MNKKLRKLNGYGMTDKPEELKRGIKTGGIHILGKNGVSTVSTTMNLKWYIRNLTIDISSCMPNSGWFSKPWVFFDVVSCNSGQRYVC